MWTGVTSLPPKDFLLRTTILISPPPLSTALMTCFLSLWVRSTSFIFSSQSFTLLGEGHGWWGQNYKQGNDRVIIPEAIIWKTLNIWIHLNLPSAILPLSTLVTNIPQSPGKYGSFTPSAISNPIAFKSMSSCWEDNDRKTDETSPHGEKIKKKFLESAVEILSENSYQNDM